MWKRHENEQGNWQFFFRRDTVFSFFFMLIKKKSVNQNKFLSVIFDRKTDLCKPENLKINFIWLNYGQYLGTISKDMKRYMLTICLRWDVI